MIEQILSAGGWLPYQQVMLNLSLVTFTMAFVAFGLLAPWYRSPVGAILLANLGNIALVLLLTSASAEFGRYDHIAVIRAIVYTGTAVNGLGLTITILKAQITNRHKPRIRRTDINGILFNKKVRDAALKDDAEWDGFERRSSAQGANAPTEVPDPT